MNHPIGPGRARDEAHRRAMPKPPRPVVEPLVVRYAAEYARLLQLAKPVMVVVLLLTTSLALDYGLASEHPERVIDYEMQAYYEGGSRTSPGRVAGHGYRHLTPRGAFEAPTLLPNGTTVIVRRTPLWRLATSLLSSPQRQPMVWKPFYSTFNLLIAMVATVAAALALLPGYNADRRTTAVLLAFTTGALLLYLLLQQVGF